jgi:hypothetical protein
VAWFVVIEYKLHIDKAALAAQGWLQTVCGMFCQPSPNSQRAQVFGHVAELPDQLGVAELAGGGVPLRLKASAPT